MNLLLVTIHAYPSPQAVPLAAACLKACLDARPTMSQPVSVSTADFFCGDSLDDVCRSVMAAKPDLVGFSLYLWNRSSCSALVKKLRRKSPGLTLFAGGPEATADPGGVLAEAPYDFLVAGEGEMTICEVVNRLAAKKTLAGVPGVALRKGGGIDLVRRLPVDDPGTLPSPYLAGVLDRSVPMGVLWQLSRGCPFGCDFCFDGMGDRTVRPYPLERLEAELDYLVSHGVSQVVVLDSTFNLDRNRAVALMRMIRKKAPHVHFHFEARAELLDSEQARLFGRLKCSLQIGLQTADAAISRKVGRPLDRRAFAGKVGLLNREGVVFGFDLIYGLPGDSLDSFRKTLDFALGLYPNSLSIFPLAVLPGTPLSARAAELRLNHLTTPPYTLLESPTFPRGDLAAAKELAAACDIFYSRGKAVAWFNGIVAAVQLPPAPFLGEFASWLSGKTGGKHAEADFRDEDIHQVQREFLAAIFTRRKARRLLAAALDLVDYHAWYAAALLATPPPPPSRRELGQVDLLRHPLAVASSARLAVFSYEILDLLEAGEPDLPRICSTCRPTGSFAVIYPRSGEVATESLAEQYYRLLERLDGETPGRDIAAELAIPLDEARQFLSFAVVEGIVVIGK